MLTRCPSSLNVLNCAAYLWVLQTMSEILQGQREGKVRVQSLTEDPET